MIMTAMTMVDCDCDVDLLFCTLSVAVSCKPSWVHSLTGSCSISLNWAGAVPTLRGKLGASTLLHMASRRSSSTPWNA